jgi:hypothetical protein
MSVSHFQAMAEQLAENYHNTWGRKKKQELEAKGKDNYPLPPLPHPQPHPHAVTGLS